MRKRITFFSLFSLLVFMIIPVNFASAQSDNVWESPCYDFTFDVGTSKGARELINCFENNPSIVNDYPDMRYWIASAYAHLKDYDNAIYYFKSMVDYDQYHTGAIYGLCINYTELGENSKALEVGNKALSLGLDASSIIFCIDKAKQKLQQQTQQTQQTQQQTDAEQKIAELETELEKECL